MTAAERLVAALDAAGCRPRQGETAGKWSARCPAHEDSNPSLSIGSIEGQTLLFCHAGCDTADVMTALGLGMADLYDNRRGREYRYNDGRIVHRYYDAGRKRFRQSGMTKALPTGCLLYRVEKVTAAVAAGRSVIVAEGEKDVEALESAGYVATCSPMGAGKAHKCNWSPLTGADVLIVADNDEPGMRHAADVAAILDGLGCTVSTVRAKVGKDAADHIAAGYGLDEFVPIPDVNTSSKHSESGEELSGENRTRSIGDIGDAWPRPRPLMDPVPPFPVECLPGPLREFASATAEALQVPTDLPALVILSILSACSGGRHVCEVKPGWTEQATVWACPVLGSGERKSPTLAAAAAPLYELERELIADSAADLARHRTEYNIAKGAAEKAERDAINGKASAQDAIAAAEAFAMMTEPAAPMLLADDITAEALGLYMARHGGRLAVVSAEGGLFATLAGRYASGEANLDLTLKAFNGEPAKVHRVSRDPVVLDRPALTLCLTVQPDVVTGLATARTLRGRGFLARLLWAVPEPAVGRRTIDPPHVPQAVTDAYSRTVTRLGRAALASHEQVRLRLDPDAAEAFRAFRARHEPRMHPDTGNLAGIADWASKLPGALVRVAMLLTLADDPSATVVTADAMRSALGLADYLAAHAQVALDMAAGQAASNGPLAAVLAWLRKTTPADFSIRDAHQALRGQVWAAEVAEVATAVDLLAGYGWVRALPAPPRTGGRPPSPRYAVHPSITSSKHSEISEPGPNDDDCTGSECCEDASGAPAKDSPPTCRGCGKPAFMPLAGLCRSCHHDARKAAS